MDEWLAGLAAREAARRSKALLTAQPLLRQLLESLAESSPYLWDLASREPERLAAPAQRRSRPAPGRPACARKRRRRHDRGPAEAMRHLRRMKAEAALLIALADIGGVWPVMRATHALTELADAAVDALRVSCWPMPRARGVSCSTTGRAERGSGYIVSPWARWARSSSTIPATST